MVKEKKKKYLWRHADGRFYVRKLIDRKMVYLGRIDAPEGTEEFDRIYWEIRTGKFIEAKRSWSALIDAYRKTDDWAEYSNRYRKDLEPVFNYLVEKMGRHDVSRLTQTQIYDAMEANRHRVRFANYIATAVSMLSKLAIRKGWRTDNPAIGMKKMKVPKDRQKAHLPWPDWAVDRFRADAQPLARLIFEIGVGSVQRPGDWVEFTWGDYDGQNLRLRQSKTDVPLTLPCTSNLRNALDAAKASLGYVPHPSRHILTNHHGNRMGYRTMADIMIKERKRLELMAFDQHALRYRGVMELAWAGCDDDEIASYSGHNTKEMIIKYAGEARQIMSARRAWEKRQ